LSQPLQGLPLPYLSKEWAAGLCGKRPSDNFALIVSATVWSMRRPLGSSAEDRNAQIVLPENQHRQVAGRKGTNILVEAKSGWRTLKWLKVKPPHYREGERGWEPKGKS
jgi:hypothetical protein